MSDGVDRCADSDCVPKLIHGDSAPRPTDVAETRLDRRAAATELPDERPPTRVDRFEGCNLEVVA